MSARLTAGFAVVLLGVLALAGCADKEEPSAVPATSAAATGRSATPATSGAPAGTPAATATTTTLPGMPQPKKVEDSAVDSSSIHSAADLPTAFKCQAGVTPIQLPSTAATAAASGAPAVSARPAAVVCASGLAGREALFLYFTPTPQDKLAALEDAFERARYVHGGPTWVAGGTIDPAMGTVGGETYR